MVNKLNLSSVDGVEISSEEKKACNLIRTSKLN